MGGRESFMESMVAIANDRLLKQTFCGKRVLVTGDTGFKGSWLCLWLHKLGADVVGYALPPELKEGLFNLSGLDAMIHHVNGDIRDFEKLEKVVGEHQPEFLFHLAAQALVSTSYKEPKRTLDTNIGGSVNILELARREPYLRSVILVTSDKCYKNKEWVWGYRENDELGGYDPYSASKAAAEMIFTAYASSFFNAPQGIGVASVRAGNVIGGGDWSSERIVPDCIRALRENKTIIIRNPMATRPWQHVLEPLSGYLLLAAKLCVDPVKYAGSWNFGPIIHSIRTVRDVAEKIVEYWGGGKIETKENPQAPYEARLLHLNCDKSQQILNWHPRWHFDRAIKETTLWYKDVINGGSALDISKRQINDYMETGHDQRS